MKLSIRIFMGPLVLFFLALDICASAAQARDIPLKGSVYSPDPGVICDKRAGFCADAEGIAVALTKMYLGDKAEARLMDRIRPEPGVQDYDTSTFVLTNKVACDCKAQKCTVGKFQDTLDAAHTKALFGK